MPIFAWLRRQSVCSHRSIIPYIIIYGWKKLTTIRQEGTRGQGGGCEWLHDRWYYGDWREPTAGKVETKRQTLILTLLAPFLISEGRIGLGHATECHEQSDEVWFLLHLLWRARARLKIGIERKQFSTTDECISIHANPKSCLDDKTTSTLASLRLARHLVSTTPSRTGKEMVEPYPWQAESSLSEDWDQDRAPRGWFELNTESLRIAGVGRTSGHHLVPRPAQRLAS